MRSAFFILALVFTNTAFAKFWIEPTLGYTSGSLKGTTLAGVALTPTEYSGPSAGLRLEYASGGTWLGLEGSYYSGKGKTNSSSYDMTDTNLGVLLGYNTMRLRIYVGYMPSSILKQKEAADTVSYSGTAYKAGLGVFVTPRLSLSAEMLSKTFTRVKSGVTEVDAKTVYGSLKDDPVSLTLAYLF